MMAKNVKKCGETSCFAYDIRVTGAYDNKCMALKDCYTDSCPFYKSKSRRMRERAELKDRETAIMLSRLA